MTIYLTEEILESKLVDLGYVDSIDGSDHDDIPDGWELRKVEGEDKIIDHDRWSVSHLVVLRESLGNLERFWSVAWNEPATEYQYIDFDPYVLEVMPVEVTKIEYHYLPSIKV